MSKIAEQKVLEAISDYDYDEDYDEVVYKRNGYIQGYDQAMQDFLKKAEELFYEQFNIHPHDCHVVQYVSDTPLEDIVGFVEQFKNYMQDESNK